MRLAIFGAGGLGREFLELAGIINEREKKWDSFVFVDDNPDLHEVQGLPVFRFSEMLEDEDQANTEYIIAVGEPSVRKILFDKLVANHCKIATLIHPDVHIPKTTTLGKGVVVCFSCLVSCNVTIGDNVVLQPQCNIGHDDIIRSHSVVSAFVNLSGACMVGEECYLGASASIRELTEIGARSIVAMGAVVLRNVEEDVVVAGNPARKMLKNDGHRVFNH